VCAWRDRSVSALFCGHRFRETQSVETVPVVFALDEKARPELAIENERRRQRMDLPAPSDTAVAIEQDLKLDRMLVDETSDPRLDLCDGDRDHAEFGGVAASDQAIQRRQLGAARLTPGRKEMHNSDGAVAWFEPDLPAVNILKDGEGRLVRTGPDPQPRRLGAVGRSVTAKAGRRRSQNQTGHADRD
jgi:hypothetical protein